MPKREGVWWCKTFCWGKMLRGKRYKGLQTILQTAGLKIIWASQTAEFMASPLCPLLLWYFGFWSQFICNMTTLFCIMVFTRLVCWAKNLLQFPFVTVRCSFDCSNHWEIIFRISFKPLRKWHCDCMDRFKISTSHWLELWSLFSHIFCPPKNWHYQFGCLAHCGGGRAVFVWNFQINYTLVDWTGIKLCRHMAAVCFSSAYWQYWWQKSCMV